VFQLVELHLKALSNRTDPRLADERHGAFSRVSSFLKLFEKPVMRHQMKHIQGLVSKRILFDTAVYPV
jgi:hypothetical protein